MPILSENTNIFAASYLTKKRLVVIFESKSTRRREIKRLKCSSKQQQRWRGGEGEKAMRYGAKGRAVHPHNQVILATHRTLITTINDSPIPSTGLFASPGEKRILHPASSHGWSRQFGRQDASYVPPIHRHRN